MHANKQRYQRVRFTCTSVFITMRQKRQNGKYVMGTLIIQKTPQRESEKRARDKSLQFLLFLFVINIPLRLLIIRLAETETVSY